ncbi:MAG: hypothetical protein LBL90_07525 [Prevotellaceae bacterium]|jgi:hypothetical protein|nr:hypothetical protein [Prevotellaceae bacterium]
MRTSIFSKKDVALMGLLVGVIFTVCLYLCSLYVKDNNTRLSQSIAKSEIIQVIE